MASTLENLQKELDEAYSTVEALRSELNEVNLLNAKLLYTNKIFKGKNLTESQKLKVLNSFDKTTTVKEVKLVYETLKEGITTSKKSLSENLGSASKAMGTTKKPIIEANDAFSRMREIAFYSAKH
jgi:predicted RNase H-like nuclease (RuvC/YqgF family)